MSPANDTRRTGGRVRGVALALLALLGLGVGVVAGGRIGSGATAGSAGSVAAEASRPAVGATSSPGARVVLASSTSDGEGDDDETPPSVPPTTVPPTTVPPTVPPTTVPPTIPPTVPPTTVPPTTPPTTGVPVAGPSGIPADCSVDVTTPLANLIARLPAGATLNLRSGGCYRVDNTLYVRGKSRLTIEGNGAELRATTVGTSGRRHLWVIGGSGITIRNLAITGVNPNPGVYNGSYPFQHGVSLSGVNGARLEHLTITNVYGDFVYVGSSNGTWSSNVSITGSQLWGAGRQGISITAGRGVVIDSNSIAKVGRSMFDLEPNVSTEGAVDVTISNNSTGNARNFWLADGGVGLNVRNVVVTNNTAVAPTGGLVWVYGPTTGYRGPFTFTGNTFQFWGSVTDSGSKGGFFFSRAQGIAIDDNTVQFPVARKLPAVESRDTLDLVVGTNRFNGAASPLLVTPR